MRRRKDEFGYQETLAKAAGVDDSISKGASEDDVASRTLRALQLQDDAHHEFEQADETFQSVRHTIDRMLAGDCERAEPEPVEEPLIELPVAVASKPSRYVVASVLLAVLAVVAGLFVPLSEAAREPASLPQISSGVSSISATASKVETGLISKGNEQDDLGRSIYAERFAKASAAERRCLARAVYYEARGEAMDGQIAVAQTVLNRARSKHWPNTICGVVNQGVERGEKCQFSFACFKHLSEPGGETWEQAQLVAEQALAGQAWLRELIEATHYHATGVAPVWRLGLSEIKTIGTHVFYRDGDGLKANAFGAQDYEAAAAKQLVNTKVDAVTKKARPKPIPGEATVAAPSRRGDDWRANVFAQ